MSGRRVESARTYAGEDVMGTRHGEQVDAFRATAGSPSTPLLKVTDLRVRLGREQPRWVVDGISYTLEPGRTLAIIGESGSGKTVGARAVMGLLPSHAEMVGSVQLEGEELMGLPVRELRRYRGPGFAMVFQDPHRSLNPTMRVGDQIAEALRIHFSLSRRELHERVIELLHMVRLPAAEQRSVQYPHQLSGGMRQRVMLAIALACRPKVLFADEATSALDVTTQAKIMELLAELQVEVGMAIVMISHNLGLASNFADDVLVVYGGRTAEQGPVDEVFDRVRMPYTKLLLDSVPSVSEVMPLLDHRGEANAAGQPSRGCAFADRCPRSQPRCLAENAPLGPPSSSHRWSCWFPLSVPEEAPRMGREL